MWTGQELIVWGGILGSPVNTGARYNPKTDRWLPLPPSPLAPRAYMPAVWTGSDMLIWSGYDVTRGQLFRDGARFNPGTNTWTPIATAGSPQATYWNTVVWTGHEMVAWGGVMGEAGNGRYNPTTNTWAALSPQRRAALALSTQRRLDGQRDARARRVALPKRRRPLQPRQRQLAPDEHPQRPHHRPGQHDGVDRQRSAAVGAGSTKASPFMATARATALRQTNGGR